MPLPELTNLVLTNNGLTHLDYDASFDAVPFFEALQNLRVLDLSMNDLNSLDNLFGNRSEKLESLTCNSCKLTSIPTTALKKLPGIVELVLNQNNIGIVSNDVFPVLGSLETLSLSNCRVEAVSRGAFQNLPSLSTLILNNNKLSELKDGTLKMGRTGRSLQKLHLGGNHFETISEDAASWKVLEKLTLGDNPWTCDCAVAWMHSLNNVDRDNVT